MSIVGERRRRWTRRGRGPRPRAPPGRTAGRGEPGRTAASSASNAALVAHRTAVLDQQLVDRGRRALAVRVGGRQPRSDAPSASLVGVRQRPVERAQRGAELQEEQASGAAPHRGTRLGLGRAAPGGRPRRPRRRARGSPVTAWPAWVTVTVGGIVPNIHEVAPCTSATGEAAASASRTRSASRRRSAARSLLHASGRPASSTAR